MREGMGGTAPLPTATVARSKLGCQPSSRKARSKSTVPHAGAGIKDQKRNIETNQALLRGFFTTAGFISSVILYVIVFALGVYLLK